jgi:hypothetical protein
MKEIIERMARLKIVEEYQCLSPVVLRAILSVNNVKCLEEAISLDTAPNKNSTSAKLYLYISPGPKGSSVSCE